MSQASSTNSNQAQKERKNSVEFYLPPNKTGKKTLVLDLDETLVHSQFGPFDVPSDVVINIEIENEMHDIHILVRPGVKEFLEKISKRFEIVIFTASISKYAGPLLDILDKNKCCSYRLFREHCTLINTSFVKDLKKLGRDLKDVIIVDNSPMAYLLNSDNGLPILTWFDDKNDRELYKICPILEFLSLVPDVRDYICKIVVNNEISYNSAMTVINDYNEMLRKKQNEKNENKENEKDSNIIDNNNELSDSSENNLVFINKDKRQININIINNNITNYIYDNNKNQNKKENNINSNYSLNKTEKNKFNPNSIIASVSKPNASSNIPSISSLINQKPLNKNKNTNSMKNLNNKEKEKKYKNDMNIKIGQHNTNYIHKKSESTGMGYKNKVKKNMGDALNVNMNNYLNNNIKNNTLKSTPFRNNTNYNSKSYNKKIRINHNLKENKMTKSAKSLKNKEKPLEANNNKNISVNKKSYNKNNYKSNNRYEKSQIGLYHNDGNRTTTHKKQKSLINFNLLKDKTYRNNYNYNHKKNKSNLSNNILHSVDLSKNEVATYYHNDNFPLFKQNNNNNNNNNKGGLSTKNNKRNNFLKTGKINNNINNKKVNNSSSLDNVQNKLYNKNNNKSVKPQNNININNNNFNYIKSKSNEKQFLFNNSLQIKENKSNKKPEENPKNNLLKENKDNKSSKNIKNNSNLNSNFDLANSCQINHQRSESMKNLTGNSSEELKISEKNRNINKNKKKGINKSGSTRQKSSNIFKKYKEDNIKKGRAIRNSSGKNGKNVKKIKYDINEILERRGIAKSNRGKDFSEGFKLNLNTNYVFNSSNINKNNKNKNKTIKK